MSLIEMRLKLQKLGKSLEEFSKKGTANTIFEKFVKPKMLKIIELYAEKKLSCLLKF